MIDIEAVMADFAVRQAERQVQVAEEIQQLKTAILPRLQEAGIARVEIRFDGCGDSGAVEDCAWSASSTCAKTWARSRRLLTGRA